jgi:protein N-terminal amidase
MDLNPRSPWTFDGGPYELADHCLQTGSSLLIMLNAWLDSGKFEDEEEDISTLNYWATLLRPLWCRMGKGPNEDGHGLPVRPGDTETVVVVCNRSGVEKGEHARKPKASQGRAKHL